ncbi:MAG: Uncharacterised protein [Euryarchaeota archaeon UBA443]|jgi:hypothetical protein|nr:hypothetical protein [Euryarchaeota archaeon]CAI8271647.1 MAG: Uncharacterised protein [Euryarchaeota archaeon UBA443]|tara:strand:+ start:686 stop:1864 length:1179 start_codon:yes stop_codon:yes gene_type:complete
MANEAFIAHGMVMLKPQVPTEKVGETMFWKRKKEGEGDGNPCPFCGVPNDVDASTCVQCYYDLDKPARDQHLEVASDVQNDLLSTLMNDDDVEEEEFAVEAVLDLEDVAIEVDQYEEDLSNGEFSFIDSEGPTLSETVEFEGQEEVELTTEDAPVIEDRFELPDSNPLDEVAEPVHTGQGQLIQTSDEEEDVDFTGSVGPSPEDIPDLPDTDEELPLPPEEISIPDIPDEIGEEEASIPELPEDMDEVAPEVPEEPAVPELPEEDVVPELPEDEVVESSPEQVDDGDVGAPEVVNGSRIWPWPAGEPMDPREVHRIVVESLGLVRAGKIQEAEHNIDALGPHLGDDVSLLYHIGLILQQSGRAEHLNWMLEMARRIYPNDESVMNAIAHLSA